MHSFMALAQQVSYAVAVAPRLLPFRELLKNSVPWYWDRKMDEVFTHTKKLLADKVEEGIQSVDPSRVTALLTDWCKQTWSWVCHDAEAMPLPSQTRWHSRHALLLHWVAGLHRGVSVHSHCRG